MKLKYLFSIITVFFSATTLLYTSEVDIKTFGTIGTVYNSNSNYIYRKDIFQKDGSSGDLSFKTDTLLGLQASLTLNENFSLLAQGIVNNNYHDEVETSIDWGYLKYDSGENIVIKIGRIRTPYYKNSENLNVGYSNLMIRESVEVYGQVPFSSYNGIEVIYSNIIDKYFYTLQANYGEEGLNVPLHSINQEAKVEIDNLYAINLTFGTTALQARFTYLNADITASSASLEQLFGGLRTSGLNTLVDRYEFKDKNSEYLGIGLFLDYNNILFSTEYGRRKISSFFADIHGYYTTLGYSFDKFIPFVTYAKSEMDTTTYDANTGVASLDTLLRAQNLAQSSKTVGLKYFINENFDLKVQYENIVPKGPDGSYHLRSTKELQELNVLSFALDFIF
ncbi:hypothetical protein Suden_1334 [Sulfurimonas denitrificans DSM 1251]|uniref:Porin domain-containing protein n=1 Tax=Sulfurimonas denitrificans (strain ATCC 33889 / DSM 1251) TaxID=326298 RepID=Q30QW9_SULDN|nr:hypothetical protein [Sulfurimonas denitrificans]ABB44612.1 hypothetical protein Suden_1334 [Sulfurimonas denitrificans DSM 1251]MDD3443447.1 hypothetical protein [Sulfurimonas denitrificans]